MSKTLALILNHNLPDYTNWLYHWLKKFEDDSVDVMVMDNGSKPELVPAYTQIRLKKNIFWGGALNEGFRIVLQEPEYDSLLFLNNDIELTPEIFVKLLRHEMFSNDLAIVSPCISGKPLPWKQMQNWGGKSPRIVRWIDNPAPLFHRKIIEAIGQFPVELQIGWGQELICYEVCRDHRWKTAVLDNLSILHYGKQTLVQNKLFSPGNQSPEDAHSAEKVISWDEYKTEAMRTRNAYFEAHPLKYESFEDHVEWALNYTYDPPAGQPGNAEEQDETGLMKKARRLFRG
jgi:hypothetical protein